MTLKRHDLFEQKMKKMNRDFQVDMDILLPHQINWDFEKAFDFVHEEIIKLIP